MPVHEIRHPLVQHKLAILREKDISTKRFRELAAEIGALLTYEATREFETETVTIECWSGATEVQKLKGKKVTIVPILRAGIGMMDGVLEMMPNAKISVVGLYRDEKTFEPVYYFEKLVKDIDQRVALILDPMLATGGSFLATVELLKKAGCQRIMGLFLVASPEGIKAVEEKHPDVELYVASVDSHLDDNAYIIPGLGDAGDKIFGTK